MSNFQDVVKMYKKFGIAMSTEPRLLVNTEMDFRLNCLHEELMELANATLAKDLPETIDALIDLTVFAMGTAAVMGVNWQEHWVEVMRANNDKEVGRGKREYSVDLIKPVGWQEPNHKKILDWEQIELPLTKRRCRMNILLEADEIIHGERVKTYGPASVTFDEVAVAFCSITGKELTARDVALLQMLFKLKRNCFSSDNRDHLLDCAGYLGIMADIQFGQGDDNE